MGHTSQVARLAVLYRHLVCYDLLWNGSTLQRGIRIFCDNDNAAEVTYWNADNIPIPYLQDSTQYVSNPDHVLQQPTVDRMNITLKKLENELKIQSVVVVVNHISNDDPFRMAQDVGNKYGGTNPAKKLIP